MDAEVRSECRSAAAVCVGSRGYRLLKVAVLCINLGGLICERPGVSPDERRTLQVSSVSMCTFMPVKQVH
jgi:hypothetical protein